MSSFVPSSPRSRFLDSCSRQKPPERGICPSALSVGNWAFIGWERWRLIVVRPPFPEERGFAVPIFGGRPNPGDKGRWLRNHCACEWPWVWSARVRVCVWERVTLSLKRVCVCVWPWAWSVCVCARARARCRGFSKDRKAGAEARRLLVSFDRVFAWALPASFPVRFRFWRGGLLATLAERRGSS